MAITTKMEIKRNMGYPMYFFILINAYDDDKEIGYQEIEYMYNNDEAYLIHIYVDKKYRRNGVGKTLTDASFKLLVEDMHVPTIKVPLYSRDGEKYIKPLMDKYRQKYPNTKIIDDVEEQI